MKSSVPMKVNRDCSKEQSLGLVGFTKMDPANQIKKVNLAEIFNAEMDAVPARGAGGPVKAPWTRLSASSNNPAKDRMRASWIEIMTGGAPWWKQT